MFINNFFGGEVLFGKFFINVFNFYFWGVDFYDDDYDKFFLFDRLG